MSNSSGAAEANRNPVRLRSFVPDDLPSLYALDQICFRKGISYSLEELASLAGVSRSHTLIAETDAIKIAGFCVVHRERRSNLALGHVITIDVHPEARKQGVGRSLMQAQEAILVTLGVRRCVLEVAVDDPGAQEFYTKLGYQVTARLPGYYMGRLDALMMEKPLRAGV
jgi:[ribosomal protein S18]-alanine N-acetyltransferase